MDSTNCRLALAFPCFDRPDAIAKNLAVLAPEAASLGIDLYFSDDSRGDETGAVVRGYAEQFDNIRYRRNSPGLGHDANVVATLAWPDADYVWLLGDVFRPQSGALSEILSFLDNQDLAFVNYHCSDLRILQSLRGDDRDSFLRERLWHQTLTGATIYSRKVISWARSRSGFHQNFPHIDIILGWCGSQDSVVGWYGPSVLHSEWKNASYWRNNALSTFARDWGQVVAAYEEYIGSDNLAKVIRSHSLNMNLFSIEFLARMKAAGSLSFSSLNMPYFWDAMHIPRWQVYFAICAAPMLRLRYFRRWRSGV